MFYVLSCFTNKRNKSLRPRVSNYNIPLIYFSNKRENVLVYLSNAIEKFCKETNFKYDGIYSKWGPYGFTKDGRLQLEEYYSNATFETYKGVDAYIYYIEDVPGIEVLEGVSNAFKTSISTKVDFVEYILDAYDAIMEEVSKGNIVLVKYEEFIKDKKDWLENIIKKEYDESDTHSEYRYFLKSKFTFL